jgi:hypothetical protein
MPSTVNSFCSHLLSIAALLLLTSAPGNSMAAQTRYRTLTPTELAETRSRLNSSLLSDFAGSLQADDLQAFAVRLQDGASLWMRPVKYRSRNSQTGNVTTRCGVFFLRAATPAVFLKTVGYNWTEAEHCNTLQAVGFSDTSGSLPRILLLYAAASPNTPVSEPFVLDWNAVDARYRINEDLSKRLEDDAEATSIQGIKRALGRYVSKQH